MLENKKIMVTKSFLPPKEEYRKYLDVIWDNNWLTNNGSLHQEFDTKVKSYLRVKNTCLFTNGHLALDIAVKTLQLKGEVITTPFTFASTIHAITMNGLTPVFCDIELDTFNIDASKIESLITERTSALIPVHVFGNPCDILKIEKIAKKYNLKVIYDAAHAFGVELCGNGIGNYGDISMFSLHATKVFHSIEGGILSFKEEKLKDIFNNYKNFGITGEESIEMVGLNAKMNEFQAAMGLANLKYIDKQIEDRKAITHEYRKLLSDIKGIKLINDMNKVKHNYAYFPIIIDKKKFGIDRNELYERLKDYHIFTRKYFYPLCSDFACYTFDSTNLVNAKFISNNVLTLPMYGELSLDEVKYICDCIKSIYINCKTR